MQNENNSVDRQQMPWYTYEGLDGGSGIHYSLKI